jgi:DNA mismatch repair protein MutS
VLEHKENNFLSSVFMDGKKAGVSFLDISTGEFLTAEGSIEYVDKLLSSFQPREVLIEKRKQKEFFENFGTTYFSSPLDEWVYTEDNARDKLLQQFQTKNLKGYGVEDLRPV